jgi:hypothetical protein
MGAEREFDHGMTDRDIALLLADAASEVEIGIAPTQAVLRGGRRRRARRWAVAAATAVVAAGSTGALAVTGLPGGDGGATPATQRPSVRGPIVVDALRTTLATGTDDGRRWRIIIDVWPAPRDELEAVATMEAMGNYGEFPPEIETPTDLIGKGAYFIRGGIEKDNERPEIISEATFTAADRMSGTDLESAAVPLDPGTAGPQRLVIGHVAKTAQEVTCTWKDGTSTVLHSATNPATRTDDTNDPAIRAAEGSPYAWFVCLAPQGTAFKSAEVTK